MQLTIRSTAGLSVHFSWRAIPMWYKLVLMSRLQEITMCILPITTLCVCFLRIGKYSRKTKFVKKINLSSLRQVRAKQEIGFQTVLIVLQFPTYITTNFSTIPSVWWIVYMNMILRKETWLLWKMQNKAKTDIIYVYKGFIHTYTWL